MSSPIRIFNFVNRLTKSNISELINLSKVTSMELCNKKIYFIFDENNYFLSGKAVKRIYFDTPEDAKKEFEEIKEQLNNFYKK